MAGVYEIKDWSWTAVSAIDLSTSPYKVVGLSTSGQATWPTGGGFMVGVVQNKPSTGQEAEILSEGITKVQHDGTVTPGAWCVATTAGLASASTVASYFRLGMCVDAYSSTGSGEYVSVLLTIGAMNT